MNVVGNAVDQLRRALALPANTLLFRADGIQVGVVRAEGKVELRHVELGRDFSQTVEILDGVATSDRVILNPPDSLAAGVTVHVAAAAKSMAAKSVASGPAVGSN